MNGLGTLLIVGIVMYFLFSRTGGIGCCGGHSHHDSHGREPDTRSPERFPRGRESEKVIDLKPNRAAARPEDEIIIDLKPEDYQVISEHSR